MNEFLKNTFWVVISCLVLAGLAPNSANAEDQLTEITWAHPDSQDISRFVVMVSPTDQTIADTRWVDVGKPDGQDSGTVSFFTAVVPVASDEFVAVRAIGSNGQMSAFSGWSPVPPTRPGQPLVVEP